MSLLGGGGGVKNGVRAELESVGQSRRELFEITGQWSGRLVIRDCVTDTVVEEIDLADVPATEVRGIHAGDMQRVYAEKTVIEEAQRDIRRAEKLAGVEWRPTVFFRQTRESREFELLARAIPDPDARRLECVRTAGVWEFVGAEAAEALISESVYHHDLEPTGQIPA
ncbi:hypothetical protein F5Y09DRAFT_346262 [Xylaria sp. FL1042]|nr:hypothetical protein F5Y09DRAFT_346262 [Xylaria sp. FL1042]